MTNNAVQNSATAALSEDIARRNRVAIVLLLAAVFVVFLNETTMSVAVPKIMDDLGITPSQGQWLTTGFALTMAVVIPVTGFLLQRLNTRPVFITAMSLFTVGTFIAATAPGFGVLILGRVVQASGTAIMMPLLMTTVLTLVPMSDRGRMMGRISIVMSVAPAIGPAVSGLILQFLAWRGLFWVMLPISAAMLVIGIARVPNVSEPRKVPLDVLSVILSAFAFSGIVFGLSNLGLAAEGNAMTPSWIPLVVGGVALALFIWRQIVLQRVDAAFLDLRTFRARTFAVSVGFLVILMGVLFGVVILLPIYLERGLQVDVLLIGLTLLPGGLAMGLLGPLVGRLYDRFGPAPLVVPGSIVMSAAIWAMTFFGPETQLWFVLATHVVLSLALGFLFTPVFTAATGALPRHLYSHGSATIATIQQVAGAAGTAVFIALLAIGTANAGAASPEAASPEQLIDGVHLAFLGGAILSPLAIVAAFFVRKPVEPEITDEELAAGH
ncbi:MDR family MFS transporter [Homoserinibacter sp. GY 40078]|uniref:MDR family MFS transporter n=1 Tax=Homoserinibacter sp. GY 40078 TaxID=2603275 RepID=UPI0011CBB2D6|nr:MDR family MFS transporter [Homoserinibacter sp. GY 40078]TXK17500.1 multidrug efflux MFS transporter [Homoserinibacter sp. GY 40078]